MDEEISIIDAKTRNERIRDFLIKNKKRLIIFLIIVIIIFLSFFGFKMNKDSKKKQISEIYNSAIVDYSNGNLAKVEETLSIIVERKDPTYSPLALYFIIDNNLNESKEV